MPVGSAEGRAFVPRVIYIANVCRVERLGFIIFASTTRKKREGGGRMALGGREEGGGKETKARINART